MIPRKGLRWQTLLKSDNWIKFHRFRHDSYADRSIAILEKQGHSTTNNLFWLASAYSAAQGHNGLLFVTLRVQKWSQPAL